MSAHTPARKWSEEHRQASPEVDALEAEYASKMTTRLCIFALARKLEAERDALKALNAELVEALRSITSGIADHLKAGTVRCDSCASEVENARAVLAKVSK